jgi:hypothetical protein
MSYTALLKLLLNTKLNTPLSRLFLEDFEKLLKSLLIAQISKMITQIL